MIQLTSSNLTRKTLCNRSGIFSTYHYSLHVVIIALLLVRDKLFTNRRCPSVLVEAIATHRCSMLKSKAASLNPVQTNIAI